LRSLEEFRKNPHIKTSRKSLRTNFQSLDKFKNPNFILKRHSLQFPAQSACSAHPSAFFLLLPKTEECPCHRLPSPSNAASASPAMESMTRAPRCIRWPFSPPPLFILRIKHHLKSSRFIPINHQPFLHLNHWPPPFPLAPK
jgi:hypothetical protein